MTVLTQSQQAILGKAREISNGPVRLRAAGVDRSEAYPWENVELLRDAGFMGMTIPKTFGGLGLGCLEAVLVIEQFARNCGVTGRILVESNLGAVGAVMAFGNKEQKSKVADLVLAGDKPAICITEKDAGSAASDMKTTARRVEGGYILNGTKHWITGGGVSRTHLVFAQVMEGDERQGIGGFLAFRDETEGLHIGNRESAMGLRGIPETEVHFQDMFVPNAMMIRHEKGFGKTFGALMQAYNGQRLGAATVAHGIAVGAFELARDFLLDRKQFGRPIAEFQGLQWMIADMSIALTATEALIRNAAARAGNGFPSLQDAAQAKILAAETAVKVTGDALQLHGARGYSRHLPLERMVRDVRMFTIGGGTVQMLRNQVAQEVLGRKFSQRRRNNG